MSAQQRFAALEDAFQELLQRQPEQVQNSVYAILNIRNFSDSVLYTSHALRRPYVFVAFVAYQLQQDTGPVDPIQSTREVPQEDLDLVASPKESRLLYLELRRLFFVLLTVEELVEDEELSFLLAPPVGDLDDGQIKLTLDMVHRDVLQEGGNGALIRLLRTGITVDEFAPVLRHLQPVETISGDQYPQGFSLFASVFLYLLEKARPGTLSSMLANDEDGPDDALRLLSALLELFTGAPTRLRVYTADLDATRLRDHMRGWLDDFGSFGQMFTWIREDWERQRRPGTTPPARQAAPETQFLPATSLTANGLRAMRSRNYAVFFRWFDTTPVNFRARFDRDELFQLDEHMAQAVQLIDRMVVRVRPPNWVDVDRLVIQAQYERALAEEEERRAQAQADAHAHADTAHEGGDAAGPGALCQICGTRLGPAPGEEPEQGPLPCCRATGIVGARCWLRSLDMRPEDVRCPFCGQDPTEDVPMLRGGGSGRPPYSPEPRSVSALSGTSRVSSRFGGPESSSAIPTRPWLEGDAEFQARAQLQYSDKFKARERNEEWQGVVYSNINPLIDGPSQDQQMAFLSWLSTEIHPLAAVRLSEILFEWLEDEDGWQDTSADVQDISTDTDWVNE